MSESIIQFQANGHAYNRSNPVPLLNFLQEHELAPELVIVEYNGAALPRQSMPSTVLNNGDSIEIVRIVAGG